MTRTLEIALEKESARLRFDRMVEFLLHGGASSKKREENGRKEDVHYKKKPTKRPARRMGKEHK